MGVPRKPTALRELHGTANRNKQRNNPNEPVPVRGIGPPPSHLTLKQKRVWDEIVGQMYKGVLGEGDRLALEVMTVLVYRFRLPLRDGGGLSGAELSRLTALLSEFGMTPASRTKIVIPKGEKQNPFEAL